jgi:hypothetical protein
VKVIESVRCDFEPRGDKAGGLIVIGRFEVPESAVCYIAEVHAQTADCKNVSAQEWVGWPLHPVDQQYGSRDGAQNRGFPTVERDAGKGLSIQKGAALPIERQSIVESGVRIGPTDYLTGEDLILTKSEVTPKASKQ